MKHLDSEAIAFAATYNSDKEDEAHTQRGEFLRRFPLEKLPHLTLENYAIGQNGRETFCYWIEPGTRKWAVIVGASSHKFGIYHGKTKTDLAKRFRYTKKFSRDLPTQGAEREVFRTIRKALVSLLRDGAALNFQAVDNNPLSQMVKAKTLSLYFPEKYLPICSEENLRDLAAKLSLNSISPCQIQYEVLRLKAKTRRVREWSVLKYTAFLYEHILGHKVSTQLPKEKPKRKGNKSKDLTVDFEKLMKIWRLRGRKSEEYALSQEKSRLRSIGYPNLANKIQDRTKKPRYGYDFESFSSPTQPRFIEVKTFTRLNDEMFRFFLSENERATANEPGMLDNYFFYLVIYDSKGEPADCEIRSARAVFAEALLQAQSYLVRLSPHSD